MLCVRIIKYFIGANSNLVGPIFSRQGLRQGDLFFPYLFILCAEGLSVLIKRVYVRRLIHGNKVCQSAPTITHLLFADDCLLFCHASIQEYNTLNKILIT